MEKFWAVILIFVVVAAAGLMYVNQVYIPQKETQMAMAEMANKTLTAVKLEIGDETIFSEVSGGEIKEVIEYYLNDNSIATLIIGSHTYNNVHNINDIENLNMLSRESQYYMK